MSRFPCFRCPECHREFYSDEAVTRHRQDAQGECFRYLHFAKKRQIERYRQWAKPVIPPLPEPIDDDFDLIEDF